MGINENEIEIFFVHLFCCHFEDARQFFVSAFIRRKGWRLKIYVLRIILEGVQE